MQIFYTGVEITNNWSEKFTLLKSIRHSYDYVSYKFDINTNKKINNLRIDFGETPQNAINIQSVKLTNLDSTYYWDSQLLYEEFYLNPELKLETLSSESMEISTAPKKGSRNIDPFIHLYRNNNRLVRDPRFYHKVRLKLKGSNPNLIQGTFSFEDEQNETVSKRYLPQMKEVTFVIFTKSKLNRSVFSLGNVVGTEYEMSSLEYESNVFSRILIGSDILKYFKFNHHIDISGDDLLVLKTKVYDGQFFPGFYSTKELKSLNFERRILFTNVVMIIIMSTLLYFVTPYLLTRKII